ncbi:MAG TPA: hypothetical protein VFL61_13680 [Gaiellaceae bacterium]|nr:hypothetical protein [Gaiellaceae bacterium]
MPQTEGVRLGEVDDAGVNDEELPVVLGEVGKRGGRVCHAHRQREAAAVREEVPRCSAERRPAHIVVQLVEAGQTLYGQRLVGRATSAAAEQRGH